MNTFTLLLATFLLGFALADGDQPESFVITLNETTFEDYVANNGIVLVKFFAEWCGHCKALKPEYEKAAKMVHEQNLPYKLTEIDATKAPNVSRKYKIDSYPTLKLFRGKDVIELQVERRAAAIVSGITKKLSPASEQLDKEKAKELFSKEGAKCVLVSDNKDHLANFTKVAEEQEDCSFYTISENDGRVAFSKVVGWDQQPALLVLLKTQDEENVAIHSSSFSVEQMTEFIFYSTIPAITPYNEKTTKLFFEDKNKEGALFWFRSNKQGKGAQEMEAKFKEAALASKSEGLIWFIVDMKEDAGKRIADVIGVDMFQLPALFYAYIEQEFFKYQYDVKSEISAEKLKEFVKAGKEKKLKRFLKTEDAPTETTGPVYKVVGSTFQKEVLDNTNDAVVLFCSEAIGQCKSFIQKFTSFADSVSHNEQLKFFLIDGSRNDLAGIPIGRMPTIRFFKGTDKKTPIVYQSAMSEEGLARFVKDACTFDVDVPQLRTAEDKEKNKEEL